MQTGSDRINITTVVSTILFCIGMVWLASLFVFEIFSPAWAIAGISIATGFGSLHLIPKTEHHMRSMDKRIRILILVSVLFCIITIFVLSIGLFRDVSQFSGSIFASWVASVFFFVSLGAIATAVTLARPERDGFDARARILFRGMSGPHVEYAIGKIRQSFEYFSESATIEITIEDYDESEKKFYVSETFKTHVHSFIADTETEYKSKVQYRELTKAPSGKPNNRLAYLRVGDEVRGSCDEKSGAIEEPIEGKIQPNKTLLIEHTVKFWINEDIEENEFRLVRFTNTFEVSIRNQLPSGKNVVVRLKKIGSDNFEQIRMDNGFGVPLLFTSNVPPEVCVYDYRVVSA